MPYILKVKRKQPGNIVGLFDSRINEPGVPINVENGKATLSPSDQHCMILGATGRGKTRRVLYPGIVMSARAGHSIVAVDSKGELFRHCAEEIRKCGHDIHILNLRNPLCGDRWSPFSLVQRYWDAGDRSRAMTLLKDIAELVMQPVRSERDGFWHMAASDTLIGFAVLLLEKKMPLTFESIHHLVNEFYSYKDRRDDFRQALDPDAYSYRRICTLTSLDTDVTSSCVVSTFNAAVGRFADQQDVCDLLLGGDYDLTDIGRRPTAFFIVLPDETTALHPIASLFIAQSYAELINYADSHEENTLPNRVDYFIDEFGSLSGTDWPAKLTAARSRGIRFVLALQTLDQLAERYSEYGARTITANCRVIEYLGGKDMKVMHLFEELGGYTTGQDGLRTPSLPVEDMAGMEMGQTIILDDTGRPRKGFLPDWEAWGIRMKADLSATRREMATYRLPDISDFFRHHGNGGGHGTDEIDAKTAESLPPEKKLELLDAMFPPPTPEEQLEIERILKAIDEGELPF